ncbi:MAG: molybdopterin-dependent oxidoreductase, partial [Syntrophobacterales bacterium]|nr:molybdopterin-dependent oxidoreductase [Syntrophobacterales bacterium]
MNTSYKTGCILCPQNCGLEVEVENNRMVKVKGDKSNVRSEGYVCRKGMNIANHQHNADRLKYPLKRVGSAFERISWEQAIDEIGAKLKEIVEQYSPRSFAYMGGGGQGCHFEAAFGVRLMRGLGSHYHYSALAQEFSGMFWVFGRMFGRQPVFPEIDAEQTDYLLTFGWNGMQSHQIPQAPKQLLRIAKDPEKMLVAIDPRLSETAQTANLHLSIRPGTDALLMRAMISIILQEGWENRDYIEKHTSGLDEIRALFMNFDARAAIRTCNLDFEQVHEICRQFATRKSSLRYDLGILMNRHSAVSSYLAVVLEAICGRIGVCGGNVFHGVLMPLGSHSDERDPKTWRTMATHFPAVMGCFPPNAMPEEILSDNPERLRAVFVSGANPLRSYADTTAYENAFKRLDLLVTAELAMTETAVLSHYVLPSRSAYESWDGTFFPMTFPGIYFQMRRPIIEPDGEPL